MSQSISSDLGNTKAKSRCRKWCFTLNNYTNDEYIRLSQNLKDLTIAKYIIGKEVGQNGTPHIQGYIEFKNQTLLSTLKKTYPRAHFEKAKGSELQNYRYCSKENNFITNIEVEAEPVKPTLFKNWQFDLEKQLTTTPPDDRSIYWYWSENGGVGKSSFVKYMVMEYNAAFINKGKHSDMINQVFNLKIIPKIILVDIPRSLKHISYSALEEIKNGLIANSKYETGHRVFNSPHIVVFANFTPEYDTFSEDRIILKCLDGEP